MGAGSVPFVNFLCLVSYRDVTEALSQGTFNYLSTMAIMTNEGAGRVLAAYLTAVAGYLVRRPGSRGPLSAGSTASRAAPRERPRTPVAQPGSPATSDEPAISPARDFRNSAAFSVW